MPSRRGHSFRIDISPRAIEEIAGIREFIAAHSPRNAQLIHNRMLHEIDELAHMPQRHGMAPEAKRYRRELRQTVVWPYRIVYQVIGAQVRVHMVRHGARRPAKDLNLE